MEAQVSDQPSLGPEQIDRVGCTCYGCILDRNVPLDRATVTQVHDMLQGRLINATGIDRSEFLTVCDGTGKVVRVIKPESNDEFLDAINTNNWRIR